MDKEEQLKRLLRLKRYEQPPEGFAEEFLEKFQRRQRSELVRRSALSILWERLHVWAEGLRRPSFMWGSAGVYAALMLTMWLWPRPVPQGGVTMVLAQDAVVSPQVNRTPAGNSNVSAPVQPAAPPVPGKRRTKEQPQDTKSLIGPEEKPGSVPEAPLRDL